MRRLTVTMFLSLDGVVQGPGGPDEDRDGGFEHGGWTVPYGDADLMALVTGWFGRASGFLLGRRTYDIFAAYWPLVTDEEDPIATRLNRLPKHVVSHRMTTPQWQHSTVIGGDVAEQVARLKEDDPDDAGGELQIHGSGGLVQSLMVHDLVDEYRLLIYPVILGTGRRLFVEGSPPTALRLVDSTITGAGVAVHTYQPAGRPTYGTYALEDS
ncbi:dihydrofolate reductase family protein [Actinoalloteichus sp. GBA129-24]|uniref:dihydrofolate reductase family protein n=1 Tax=Actinoalloteichus sp. GBA129-24 TaxID=1612551 RepID=UPI000950AE01|nr:dihydrofolate reductase family protein [Actinoalloteichus sp. GBA129-24]APU21055.1 dihydrofolate reductase [Actinoalloteichus sp. GBA129-24]